jgi:hypothetical protein
MLDHLMDYFDPAIAAMGSPDSEAALAALGTLSLPSNADLKRVARCLPSARELIDEFNLGTVNMLLPDQQAAFDGITSMRTGLVLLAGGPGCGKSYLTQRLMVHFRQVLDLKTLATAATGAASVRLSLRCGTVHGTFAIPAGRNLMRFLHPAHPMRTVLEQAKVIFIDEMSMMSTDVFNSALARLQQVHRVSSVEELLQKVLIVLVGDDAQVGA